MDIQRKIRNIDRVIQALPSMASELIKKHEKEVLAIQEEQLDDGFRGDGDRTQKYISDAYIKRENKKSAKSFPHRNYRLTGDFINDLKLDPNGDEVFFYSMNEKAALLEKEEEGKLLGIMPDNNDRVGNIIAKELIIWTGNEIDK